MALLHLSRGAVSERWASRPLLSAGCGSRSVLADDRVDCASANAQRERGRCRNRVVRAAPCPTAGREPPLLLLSIGSRVAGRVLCHGRVRRAPRAPARALRESERPRWRRCRSDETRAPDERDPLNSVVRPDRSGRMLLGRKEAPGLRRRARLPSVVAVAQTRLEVHGHYQDVIPAAGNQSVISLALGPGGTRRRGRKRRRGGERLVDAPRGRPPRGV
jgi:hypothetical protein